MGERRSELPEVNLQTKVTRIFSRDLSKTAKARGQTVPDFVRAALAEAVYGPIMSKHRATKARRGERV